MIVGITQDNRCPWYFVRRLGRERPRYRQWLDRTRFGQRSDRRKSPAKRRQRRRTCL